MSLEIVHREREGITLIDLKGRIVVGEEASIFRNTTRPGGTRLQTASATAVLGRRPIPGARCDSSSTPAQAL
jgi:hypothetical protein